MTQEHIQEKNQEQKQPLEFTGNWFIDAGILGFVNLMEEVYGDVWRNETRKSDFLEILQEKIDKNPDENRNDRLIQDSSLEYLLLISLILLIIFLTILILVVAYMKRKVLVLDS